MNTILFPYQKKWVQDRSRFKLWVKARQIGGSHAAACECVMDAIERAHNDWIIISSSQDNSDEFMRKCKAWANAFSHAQYTEPLKTDNTSEIEFKNGSRIIARSSNEKTARGFSTNLVLDEFGFHENSELIWNAVLPIITNEIAGQKKVRIISTPNGLTNKFYELWSGDASFSKHRTSIHDAIAEGFPCNIAALKDKLSVNGFRQEYECEFLDNSAGDFVFSSSTIQTAMNSLIHHAPNTPFAFIDFAAGGDENVLAIRHGNYILPLECWTDRDTKATVGRLIQRFRHYQQAIGLQAENIYCDESGMGGIAMANDIRDAGWPIQGVSFGAQAYQKGVYLNRVTEMYFDTKMILENKKIHLPNDKELFAQLTSRKCFVNPRGVTCLEPKKGISKSPDRADAVCGVLSCSEHLQATPHTFEEMFRQIEEEDNSHLMAGFFAGY